MRYNRAKAAAVAHEIRDRQILVAHHHDIIVEPSLIDWRKTPIVERLDVDPGDLHPDLRPHAANFHRSFLPKAVVQGRPRLCAVSTGRNAMVAMRLSR